MIKKLNFNLIYSYCSRIKIGSIFTADIKMLRNSFILLYHSLEAFLNLYMLYWNVSIEEQLYFLQNFCYLTIITHTFLCLYCLMVIDYDIQYFRKNFAHNSIRYPPHIHTIYQLIQGMGAVVMLAYWGLRLFKPTLLFPEGFVLVPELLTSSSHGGNYVILTMELGLYEQKRFFTQKQKFQSFLGIVIAYMGIQSIHRHVYGYHIYPFLEVMSYEQLTIFYLVLFGICVGWDFVFCRIFVKKARG